MAIIFISCHSATTSTTTKETIGRRLFFDNRLSVNNTKSCASCHNPALAFSDGYRTSATALGENTLHNAPSLINSSVLHYYNWANPALTTLALQIKKPLYNTHPIELGFSASSFLEKIKFDSIYQTMFNEVYKNTPMTNVTLEECIVAFVKTINSYNSNYDKQVFSASAYRGMKLFMSQELNCASCHRPPTFTMATVTFNTDSIYICNGLYNTYPNEDNGIFNTTKKNNDEGKYKIPSLRNCMITSPYMHDGSLATLGNVLDFYAKGGNNHKNKDKRLKGFTMSKTDKQDLINFLSTLTDTTICNNSSFQNPTNY